jgi:hypothetical protein
MPIFAHRGQIAPPQTFAEKFHESLNLMDSERFLKCEIDSRRVRLLPECARRLFKKVLVKHNICALHVCRIPPVSIRDADILLPTRDNPVEARPQHRSFKYPRR